MSFFYLTSDRGQGGSILLEHYSMVVLKPAILIFSMAEVRYNSLVICSLYLQELCVCTVFIIGTHLEEIECS